MFLITLEIIKIIGMYLKSDFTFALFHLQQDKHRVYYVQGADASPAHPKL